MTRLLVHVEGQTEEQFVNFILRDHLTVKGYTSVSARGVGDGRSRAHRQGIKSWSSVRSGIVRHLREDSGSIITTMVDYYALPSDWPQRNDAGQQAGMARAECIENAMSADVTNQMGPNFNPQRFVPFVVLHEFEGLLFSDCVAFAKGIERPTLQGDFQRIRDQFETPEDINDSPQAAPSKRILNLIPGYQKPHFGVLAILSIGLESIRRECPHFNQWIERLESRVQALSTAPKP